MVFALLATILASLASEGPRLLAQPALLIEL